MSEADLEPGYPLSWPVGRPRTRVPYRSGFGEGGQGRVPVGRALREVREELRRLGVKQVVISCDLQRRLDGEPMASGRVAKDQGVAVYFTLNTARHCLACDKWDDLGDNLWAIAKHIDSIRGQSRWGVGDIAAAFAGYRMLVAMGAKKPWWEILGYKETPVGKMHASQVEAKWRDLIAQHHPDRGGNSNQAAEVNAAWTEGREAFGL